ncbi:MAG: fumarylacetoacetate hydrolase family protein [Candidatus Hodarchaeales archaeon]
MKIGKSNNSIVVWEKDKIKRYDNLNDTKMVVQDPSILSHYDFEELQTEPSLELPITSNKILCLAKNYRKHAKEMGVDPKDLPSSPTLFLKPPTSLIGPGENIVFPPQTKDIHHEVELAVIIGKKGKNISLEESLNHVFGYTILLDITARDLQTIAKKKGRPWFQSKGFDTFAPIGPVITSADEISDVQNLDISLKVNGDLRQKGNTSQMIFNVQEIVSYSSTIVTLEPGDIIATGTPEGVGPLKKGDKLEAYIENIGFLHVGVI